MTIGIFSDVHDNLVNLQKVIDYFHSENITTAIFCGDFCSPIPSRLMGTFNGSIHCVFGNGDGDRFMISKIANSDSKNLILYGEHAEFSIENRKIAVTHYPLYGYALANTANYDAVFSGHTHQKSKEYIKNCLWLNPGEVMGWKGNPTIAVYSTQDNDASILEL